MSKKITKGEVLTSLLTAISQCAYVGIYSSSGKTRELDNGQSCFFITYLGRGDQEFLGERQSLTYWDEEGFPKEHKIYHFRSEDGVITELAIETKYIEKH